MTEPTELLPCPFCGGINIIHCSHHMYCHACGADGPDADSQHESEAIAAWNTRTPQPTQAQAGALESAEFGRFLSDVLTAAGLVTHGKQCKALGGRLADMCAKLRHHGIKRGQHG